MSPLIFVLQFKIIPFVGDIVKGNVLFIYYLKNIEEILVNKLIFLQVCDIIHYVYLYSH